MTVSNQEELHSGTLRQARALALMIKSFTLSLMFWDFTSCRGKRRGGYPVLNQSQKSTRLVTTSKLDLVELFPKLEHLVHVDVYRQVVVGDGLFGLHQPLSDDLEHGQIC